LYDLAAHPEWAEVLREEIKRITAEEPNGRLRKKTMPKLRKLDSFIKESQRINPLGSGKQSSHSERLDIRSLLCSNVTTCCHCPQRNPPVQW
jgi:hypothetical protein